MAVQVGKAPFTLVWDDGFMLIFSFPDPVNSGQTVFCGFPHQVLSVANQAGNQIQVTPTQSQITQLQFQIAADPATWVETIKTAARAGTSSNPQVSYDDSISSTYTAQVVVPASGSNPAQASPGQTFTLQLLYSIVG